MKITNLLLSERSLSAVVGSQLSFTEGPTDHTVRVRWTRVGPPPGLSAHRQEPTGVGGWSRHVYRNAITKHCDKGSDRSKKNRHGSLE